MNIFWNYAPDMIVSMYLCWPMCLMNNMSESECKHETS